MRQSGVVEHGVRILLGGGIGAGKSAAANRLAYHGLHVVEADHIGHGLLEPGEAAFASVAQRWPEVLVGGQIDRGRLAAIVFPNADALAELEAMTHPEIVRRIEELGVAPRHVAVEIPVLIEPAGDWTKVLIVAPRDVRHRRAVERGHTPEDVQQRMDRQAGTDAWIAWADETITNNGTLEDLEREVDALWHRLRAANLRTTP